MQYAPFTTSTPVWAENELGAPNCTLGLYATVSGKATLRIAVSGFYRVFINGEFFFYGPARCAEGFSRVDELPLDLPDTPTHIAIETINYALNSFCYMLSDGFIQAEIEVNGQIVAATGKNGFTMFRLDERVRRVQRYSYQRPAAEAYHLTPDYADWRVGKTCANAVEVSAVKATGNQWMPRRIPLNTFPTVYANEIVGQGTVVYEQPEIFKKDRSLTLPNYPQKKSMGFPEDQLEWHLSDDVQCFSNVDFSTAHQTYDGVTQLTAGQFRLLSLPCAKTGFVKMHISCQKAGTLYVLFDETLRDNGDINPLCRACCNVIRLDTAVGEYDFEAMEPFGMRFIKLLVPQGTFTVRQIGIRELICPQPIIAQYTGKDPQLAAIFAAAKETFCQSSSDIFMDCPTRERAGWLCDSYFTARAEREFTGENVIEYNFLENFLLPDNFRDHPKGMFPMCYPADHPNGRFIPNWAMFLILELEDYLKRTGDRNLIDRYEEKAYALVHFFEQYENADGLLEFLPQWVFVEWSKANKLVQDINFPSNMMYAYMLETIAALYDDAALVQKAAALKQRIRDWAFDGEFFIDNAVYQDGKAELTGERTEVCQYYAFFTGVATPQTHPALWETLVKDFGPHRKDTGAYPEIYEANAFIGNYLRLMLLEDNGLYAQLLDEIREYFYYMANITGTLWEHVSATASCIHGFASYVAHFIRVAEET